MPAFTFKAVESEGRINTGTIDARSKTDAYQQLIARKLRPITIHPIGGQDQNDPDKKIAGRGQKRISSSQLLVFTEELAELLEAGLQLEPALKVIGSRKEVGVLQGISAFLRQQVREGISFSSALRNSGSGFSELYCSMVAAGERAGALTSILRRQAEYLVLVMDLRRRIAAALIYPSIVFTAGIVLLVIFMTFLLPQLTMLLSKTGKELPWMTQALIATSDFFGNYWWVVVAGAATLLALFIAWIRMPDGRMAWDRLKLSIPLVGAVMSAKFVAEFCQTLATLVLNGLTLLDALVLFQKATRNVYLKELIGRITEKVGEGAGLSMTLRTMPFFPSVLADIVTVGEQSGDLAGALQRGAKRFDREFGARIQTFTALIQPLTILIVALFVGIVAYSMITGILSSVSGLRTR